MEYGNIVLANSKKGFVPSAIRWFTGSKFSHSLVTMPDILEVPMCMEAGEMGVDMLRFDMGYADNAGQGYQTWRVKLPQATKDAAIRSILVDLELMYGFFQYPWFMWRRLNLFFGRDIKSQNNWSKGGMICSQLCVAYLHACGLAYIFEGYGAGTVAPQDLQRIFMAHPELFEMIEEVRMTE